MKEHLRRSFLYKHSQFLEKNSKRITRPFKNITLPILNIAYRTEGFDVKNIELYVNNADMYYKSFVVRKFHDKWAVDNSIDTLIDDIVQSYVDYGGVLVKDVDKRKPEVVNLRSIAFCNQADLLNYPFAIKHKLAPSQIRQFSKWGNEGFTIEEFLTLVKNQDLEDDRIEVYEVHGLLPGQWLTENDDRKDVPQIQIVSFYKDSNDTKKGITLFKHEEPKLPFKFLKRDKIHGRALGFGGIEELFEPQTWTNFSEIKIMEMLKMASKTLFKTTDPTFKSRQNIKHKDNGEVLVVQDGKDIGQLDTYPRNIGEFKDMVVRLEEHANKLGSASEGLLGESPSAGTPFKLFEAQTTEAKGMHNYRKGQIAVFVDEIYRDWSLPHIAKDIRNEQKFLTELSSEEVQQVVENIVTNQKNGIIKKKVLENGIIDEQEIETLGELQAETLRKNGTKWFVNILKDEFADEKLGVLTNIAGKQKDLALLTDKLVNLVRQFISTPQLRQDPEMNKLLNTILESSGMSPIMLSPVSPQQIQQPIRPTGGSTEPLKDLAKAV